MKITLFCCLTALLLAACGPEPATQAEATAPAKAPDAGTAQMIKLVQEAHAKIDVTKLPFLNSPRSQVFKQQMEASADPQQKWMMNLQFAYELLGAGKNEQALTEFEKLLTSLPQGQPQAVYQLKKMLGLSYLRLGETNNCINRYNEEACLMPLKGKGIYAMQEASRSAISVYEEMLRMKPDDHEAVWLLNFAYMTVGEYPQKVPKQWLIPEESFRSDYPLPLFRNIAQKIGVGTVGLSGGACVEDFNNDGLLDIVASSWGLNDQIRFFVNKGDGTFSERTKEAGLTGITGGLNTQHADYDNDGWVDVLLLRGGWFQSEGAIPNSLLRNNGDGTFSDVTIAAGMLSYHPTQTAAWADFNNDGWLDVFIGNESDKDFRHPCELFINNRNGTFTDRIKEAGLGELFAYVKGVAAGDVNNDGWTDLYLSSLNSENILLMNQGDASGQVVFAKSRTAKVGEPLVSFPTWMFDFNNDGWLDLFAGGFGTPDGAVAAALATQNYQGKFVGGNPHLYLNNGGSGTFSDISRQAGLDEAMYVMGSNYGDLDNDGWLDFYLGTGAPGLTAIVPNKMFRNNQGKTLQDVTTSGGFGHIQKGHGVGFGDFDCDGDQDIFSVIGGAMEGDVFGDAFFLNPMGNQKSWSVLRLEGKTANRSAVGARVKITSVNGAGQVRATHFTVGTGGSFGGNSLQIEAGLDDATAIQSVEVRWPNREGTVSVFAKVPINKYVKLTEGKAEVEVLEVRGFQFL